MKTGPQKLSGHLERHAFRFPFRVDLVGVVFRKGAHLVDVVVGEKEAVVQVPGAKHGPDSDQEFGPSYGLGDELLDARVERRHAGIGIRRVGKHDDGNALGLFVRLERSA